VGAWVIKDTPLQSPLMPSWLFFSFLFRQAGNAELKSQGLRIKEGANFKFQLSFRVNHELLEALKFVNKTKRCVITSDRKSQETVKNIDLFFSATRGHTWSVPCATAGAMLLPR
jgi:hypothetical protein